MKTDLIKPLHDLSIQDVPDFGGKASSLGELIKAGFPVPPGFAIAAVADQMYRDRKMPDGFLQALASSFRSLRAPSVAVRSSALAEDSLGASWAGQLESFLDVPSSGLADAVRSCWLSAGSGRAKDYASRTVTSSGDLLVGVVVQSMLHPDSAGVMFTANPVTGAPGIVIEAAFGLGELVVQGAITPDHFETDPSAQKITTYQVAHKNAAMFARSGRHEITELRAGRADQPALTRHQVIQLAEVGTKIAAHFKRHQDIEWCLENGKFWIVQSRPITTLDT